MTAENLDIKIKVDTAGAMPLRKAFEQLVEAHLRVHGFESWGKDAWVRFEDGGEQGGTCYDTGWALREIGKDDLAETWEAGR